MDRKRTRNKIKGNATHEGVQQSGAIYQRCANRRLVHVEKSSNATLRELASESFTNKQDNNYHMKTHHHQQKFNSPQAREKNMYIRMNKMVYNNKVTLSKEHLEHTSSQDRIPKSLQI